MTWKLPFCLQNLSHPHTCAPARGCASGTKGDVHGVFLKLVEAGEGGSACGELPDSRSSGSCPSWEGRVGDSSWLECSMMTSYSS